MGFPHLACQRLFFMKIDMSCIDPYKPLYGFWKYDSAPFILGGNIKSITKNNRITVEGYTGYEFKPLFITTKEKGEEIQKRIDTAEIGRAHV